jgi:hypothetical protein
MDTQAKERGRVVLSGMGGFLNPPTHPEHTHSVETGRRSNPDCCMSLTSAVESEWLDDGTRLAAKTLLDSWKRPAIESPEVQDWILQVLGYFRNCYKGDGPEPECWHAGKLRIINPNTEALPSEIHAGVHLIRQYYPEYQPTRADFEAAYWGTHK